MAQSDGGARMRRSTAKPVGLGGPKPSGKRTTATSQYRSAYDSTKKKTPPFSTQVRRKVNDANQRDATQQYRSAYDPNYRRNPGTPSYQPGVRMAGHGDQLQAIDGAPGTPGNPSPTAGQVPVWSDDGGDWGGYGGGGDWGGGGGGGGSAPAPITWSAFGSKVEGAPAWWKAMKPSEMNEESEYLASLNMLIPFLSPEDQKTTAATLYQMDAKNFGHLNPEGIVVPETRDPANNPTQLVGAANSFTLSARAQRALAAMTELAGAVGKTDADLGPGYRYLRSIIDTINQYGGASPTEGQTRAQYQKMLSAVDPLLNQSKSGSLGAYGPLASMLAQPFFYGGQLTPATKNQDGSYSFGSGNKSLY